MIYRVYSIRDRATSCFAQPFYSVSDSSAIRAFKDEVNRPDSVIGQHPEDYDLFNVGTFDDSIGGLVGCTPDQIAIGKEMVKLLASVASIRSQG